MREGIFWDGVFLTNRQNLGVADCRVESCAFVREVELRADCARNTAFKLVGWQVRRLELELLGQEKQTSLSVKIFAEEFLGVVKFHHVFQQLATGHNVRRRVFARQRAFLGVA